MEVRFGLKLNESLVVLQRLFLNGIRVDAIDAPNFDMGILVSVSLGSCRE